MWPILALIVLFPKTPGQILFGNTDMWVAAAIAGGVRWAWPSVLVTFKPSLAFFALIGIRARSWWIAAGLFALGQPSVPLALAGLPGRDEQLERQVLVLVRKPAILCAPHRRVSRFEPAWRRTPFPTWTAWSPSGRRMGHPRQVRTASIEITPGSILAIFVLSGAAGLIYEVVWARQLVLVFGNTTQAVSTILTGFFGGIAIGSVARRPDRRPGRVRRCGCTACSSSSWWSS